MISVRVGGVDVAVRETEGSGRPVVLLHGNSGSSNAFRHQLEGALGRRLRLVSIDLPGHGDSSRGEDDVWYTVPAYAEVLVAVARELGVDDAVFAGWSLGGHAVIEASERMPDAAGFLVWGTPPLGKPAAMAEAFAWQPAFEAAFRADSTDAEIEALQRCWVREGSAVPQSFLEDFRRTDPRARAALGASIRRGDHADEIAIVSRMKQPLAIIHGAHDAVVRRSYFDTLSIPTLWRGHIQDLEHVGHAAHLEDPSGFEAVVTAFVADCER